MNENFEKMHNGELYFPNDKELAKLQMKCLDRLYDFNQTRPTEMAKRQELLKEMFAEIGEGCYIEPPFHANFGGRHVHFGNHVYANFNLTAVDDTHIYVGDHTMIVPVQHADPYRQKLLARCRNGRRSRGFDRRQHRYRCRQHRDEGHSRKRRGSRQSVSRDARNRRTRQRILLQGQENR